MERSELENGSDRIATDIVIDPSSQRQFDVWLEKFRKMRSHSVAIANVWCGRGVVGGGDLFGQRYSCQS